MIARAILPAAIAVCCLTAGCENSLLDRSLVFFTNTTIGIEVSVSPSDATAPVKLIIGYKRAEGVLNPVYHSQGVEEPVTTDESEALTGGSSHSDKDTSKSGSSSYSKKWSKSVAIPGGPKTIRRYRTEAYSVIAKIAGEVQGKAGGSADGKLSVAQWFATGEAAKILANQPGIAGAVTGSSEIAKHAADEARFGKKLPESMTRRAVLFLGEMYDHFGKLGTAGDETARQHRAKLDAMTTELLTLQRHRTPKQYTVNDTTKVLTISRSIAYEQYESFKSLTDAWSAWYLGVAQLRKALLLRTDSDFRITDGTATPAREPTPADWEALSKALEEYKTVSDQFTNDLQTHPTVLAAAQYYASLFAQ